MKRFKRHIHLIRYAVRRAVHRVDYGDPVLKERLAVLGESLEDRMKGNDWLQWAKQKLGRMR